MGYRDTYFDKNDAYDNNNGWYKCKKCGRSFRKGDMDIDHIIPQKFGGSDSEYNLQCICKHCNRSKQAIINDDKSLSVTSGIGEAWGNFVKTSNIVESGLLADESGICKDVEQGEFNTYMKYDGDVLDELLADAWYDESGTPLADELPKVIGRTYPWQSVLANQLENFEFIKGNLDYLRRYKNPSYDYSYALLIQNIQKRDNGLGETIYQGTEYFSKETVIFTGNFNGVMNGDDLIMFGIYTGMATDDTVNFEAYYLELHNGDF